MRICLYLFVCLICLSCSHSQKTSLPVESQQQSDYAIVIHGGAGYMTRLNMTEKQISTYKAKLTEAISVGEEILQKGGNSLDAVVETIKILEDSPLFNAGKGAVFASDTTNQMDASIMTGYNQNAGAVAGVMKVKNPITAARAVLEKSDHVLLSGKGADQFAEKSGCEIVDPDYFKTEKSLKSLYRSKNATGEVHPPKFSKMGTVGCVALDKHGNISAGTSTGGMTNKKFNRIGDSPIIAAGTYADQNCGISCTGHGEYFIRYAVAYDIAARVKYLHESIMDAADFVVNNHLVEKGGDGGVIALDKHGNIAMPFNTKGMFRGYAKPEIKKIEIF